MNFEKRWLRSRPTFQEGWTGCAEGPRWAGDWHNPGTEGQRGCSIGNVGKRGSRRRGEQGCIMKVLQSTKWSLNASWLPIGATSGWSFFAGRGMHSHSLER